MLLASVEHDDLKLHQMDVVTSILNGGLHEKVYMKVLEGIIVANTTDMVR